jgi:hypothetical protein
MTTQPQAPIIDANSNGLPLSGDTKLLYLPNGQPFTTLEEEKR